MVYSPTEQYMQAHPAHTSSRGYNWFVSGCQSPMTAVSSASVSSMLAVTATENSTMSRKVRRRFHLEIGLCDGQVQLSCYPDFDTIIRLDISA